MITIDPLDDEVVRNKKPARSNTLPERRSSSRSSITGAVNTGMNRVTHRHSRLAELAQRLLRALRRSPGEEEERNG